jgi:hypothetical protein
LTNFKLEDKHKSVDCKLCHKTNYTNPIKHNFCSDCHSDYHNNQFVKNGVSPDCSDCHTTKGFTGSTFTIERHNEASFKLEGAHLATPCFVCHKKQERWNFRDLGNKCVDCHDNIHEPYLDIKYYPEEACENCHSNNIWSEINFNHTRTNFILEGAHHIQTCKACHTKKDQNGQYFQKFSGLSAECVNCHKDVHNHQFESGGVTNCLKCHGYINWKAEKFNHNDCRFPLDGKHQNVECNKCHKSITEQNVTYVQYKFEDISCESCH